MYNSLEGLTGKGLGGNLAGNLGRGLGGASEGPQARWLKGWNGVGNKSGYIGSFIQIYYLAGGYPMSKQAKVKVSTPEAVALKFAWMITSQTLSSEFEKKSSERLIKECIKLIPNLPIRS